MKKLLLSAAALTLLSTSVFAADAKSYQVTGPVLELTDSTITVQKGTEKWQIARGNATLSPDVKVGAKVTIQYKMTADSVEVKTPAKDTAKKDAAPKKTADKAPAKDAKAK